MIRSSRHQAVYLTTSYALLKSNSFVSNLRILIRIFQPPISRKMRIVQPGLEKHYSCKSEQLKQYLNLIHNMKTTLGS